MLIHGWKIAGVAAVGVGLGVYLNVPKALRIQKPGSTGQSAGQANARMWQAHSQDRKVFPYSVIPGGAASGVELREALFRDRVAASHYAGFHLDRTRVESLRHPQKVFVSYRIADRVYWTRNRLTLPKGETILTDGVSSARTRCGNRISETPQLPVNPAREPTQAVLNTEAPEAAQTDWNSSEHTEKKVPEKSTNRQQPVEKLESNADSPGGLLAKFGPPSLSSISGAGSPSGGMGQPTGTSGSIGSGGRSAAGVGVIASAPLGQTVFMVGTAAPSVPSPSGPGSNSTVTLPASASPGTTYGVSTQQQFIGGGGLSFPTLPPSPYLLPQPTESWAASSSPHNDSLFPGLPPGSPVPLSGPSIPSLILSAAVPHQEPSYQVQTPEPGTANFMVFGFVLLLLVRYAELWRRSSWKGNRKLREPGPFNNIALPVQLVATPAFTRFLRPPTCSTKQPTNGFK